MNKEKCKHPKASVIQYQGYWVCFECRKQKDGKYKSHIMRKQKDFKKGDKVVICNCMEENIHKGKIWTCKGDSFLAPSETEVVFLEGYSGFFSCYSLALVNVSNYLYIGGDIVFKDGKHEGKTFDEVLKIDSAYLIYLFENVNKIGPSLKFYIDSNYLDITAQAKEENA